jgi:hypothetical protein
LRSRSTRSDIRLTGVAIRRTDWGGGHARRDPEPPSTVMVTRPPERALESRVIPPLTRRDESDGAHRAHGIASASAIVMNINTRNDLPRIAFYDLGRVTGGLTIVTPDGKRLPCTEENFMKYVWNHK